MPKNDTFVKKSTHPIIRITFIASSNAFWWPFQCLFARSIWAPPLLDRYYGQTCALIFLCKKISGLSLFDTYYCLFIWISSSENFKLCILKKHIIKGVSKLRKKQVWHNVSLTLNLFLKLFLLTSSPWKWVTNCVLEWMRLNFYDNHGLEPKMTNTKHYYRQCSQRKMLYTLSE